MSAKPDFYVFAAPADDKTPLVRIGAAWHHGKGEGINIVLNAHPIGDRLVLFVPKDDDREPPKD